jgi:hypothetical protein
MLSMSTKERSVEQEHGKHETSQLNAKSVMKKDIPVIAGEPSNQCTRCSQMANKEQTK